MDKKKRVLIIGAAVIILAAGYFGWKHFYHGRGGVLEASGTIEATTAEVSVKVAGVIGAIQVAAGDKVIPGQEIAVISRNDLLAQKERDTVNVEIARNQLDQLLAGARSQQIEQAEASANIQQLALEQAEKELTRAMALFEEGSIAEAELEKYRNNRSVAQSQLTAARANLNLLLAGSSPEEIEAARNQVKMMQAVLAASEAVVADLKLTAPLEGIVQRVNYEPGEYAGQGASLVTIAQLDKVWLNIYIPTEDLPYIHLGQSLTFTVSGHRQVFTGVIGEIASQGEFTPKTIQTKKERVNIVYKVKIKADNSEGILKPGMPADVLIPIQAKANQAEGRS